MIFNFPEIHAPATNSTQTVPVATVDDGTQTMQSTGMKDVGLGAGVGSADEVDTDPGMSAGFLDDATFLRGY